jgi:hypothetical protein
MLRVLRVVASAVRTAGGWDVTLAAVDPAGVEATLALRALPRVGDAASGVPVPPAEEVAALTSAERATPWGALCAAADQKPALDALRRLAARALDDTTLETVGRYLFATLLGPSWETVRARAAAEQAECVELALRWPAAEWELTRLPWELLRSDVRFLAAERKPRVAVTRLVAGAAQDAAELRAPVRVLFVVAAPLGSPQLRPGAEYLALVRRLRGEALALNARVLLDASPARFRDAVAAFRPSVVHVISHGQLDDRLGAATLELAADEGAPDGKPSSVGAEALDAILRAGGAPPAVVVLNACFTSAAVPQVAVPLSAQLVARGVPVVVGMAGRVADRACRLFTRRFYEALLRGEPIAVAAAEGRLGAFTESGVPESRSVDWALPTLTVGERVPASLAVADAAYASRVEAIVREYARIGNPPVLCGRLECLDAFATLFVPKGAKRVMLLDAAERAADAGDQRPAQYGKTRLLQTLAAAAVRDGRVPCLLAWPPSKDPPVTPPALGVSLVQAIHEARALFKLPQPAEYEIERLERVGADEARAAELSEAVRQARRRGGNALAAAVRVDLAALAADADAVLPPVDGGGSRVVVLVDDAHRLGAAASALVEEGGMLGTGGLGTADAPVPAVIAYSSAGVAQEHGPAVAALTQYAQTRSPSTAYFKLAAFGAPDEDYLPYAQFLLGIDQPLVFRPESGGQEGFVLRNLHECGRGVPSRFELAAGAGSVVANAQMRLVLKMAVEFGLLVAADDDAVLRAIAEGGDRGAS